MPKALIYIWYLKGGSLFEKVCLLIFLRNSKICKTKLYSLVENNYEDQKNKIGSFLEKMTGEAIVTKFLRQDHLYEGTVLSHGNNSYHEAKTSL